MSPSTDDTDKSTPPAAEPATEQPASLVSHEESEIVEDAAGKPDAPASEVADFQDAASSMGAMSSDAPPAHGPDFVQEEQQTVVEETVIEGRSARGSRRPRGSAPRRGSARDIMLMELPQRARNAPANLKAQLRGTILLKVNDGRERYLLDWRGEEPSIKEVEEETAADCVIALEERDLASIASGGLNPQIAMLTTKISISGTSSFAVYFFNLIAPPAMH